MSEAFPATALPVPPLSLALMQKQASGKMLMTPWTPKATTCVLPGRRLGPARVQGRYARCGRKIQTREAAGMESSRMTGISGKSLFNAPAPNTPAIIKYPGKK